MCNSSRQLTDGLHFLQLPDLIVGFLAMNRIFGQPDVGSSQIVDGFSSLPPPRQECRGHCRNTDHDRGEQTEKSRFCRRRPRVQKFGFGAFDLVDFFVNQSLFVESPRRESI